MLLSDDDLLRIERAYCAQSLARFAERAWHVLEPATPLKWGWALDAICEHLEAVTSGEIKRLLVNVPPGPMRGDSMVETGRGLLRLDDVVVGDTVLTHKGRYRKVEAVHDQGVLPILKITTHSGRETFAAPSHPYLTPAGWVAAGNLKIGDCLAVVNPQEPRNNPSEITTKEARRDFDSVLWCDPVVSIESAPDAHCMCLTVADDHSFTCSGIAVHNCMKSLLTGVIWPAWEWGPRNLQSMRYLGTAHKQDLAVRDSTKCRRLIQSEWYQRLWPIELTGDQNAKTKFENTKTGFRESMSFTSLTGSRADRVLLDDPLSADDANSEAALRTAEITFTESLPTRVNNDQSAIVVIMQRLHDKDTSGIILSRDLGYTHLCLPMRYEAERKCTTSIGFSDPRTKDGELLFPERFSEKQVKELETILGSYAAAGQLQQRPAPREGGMFKRSWFNVVRAIHANTQFVRGWDLAATNGAGDWTVGVKLGRMPSGRFLIAGVERDQLSSAGVERLIVNTASQDGLECRISLPQDPGQAGKAQASYLVQKLAGYNVTTSTESGDKVTRAGPMAAQAEAGNIDILEGDWNDAFLNELSIFPAGSKDQTDAASRAFNELVMSNQFNLHSML